LVETIPVAQHDEPVDIIVTDEEIIYTKGTCEEAAQ
jgi:5-formyltetrahydrofolate cyclo-ligase